MWIEPLYSKEQVKQAGQILVSSTDPFEMQKAITILNNWRAAHAFPMQIMLDLLRKNSIRVDEKALAVQRLKRVSSIYDKLLRESKMNLSRMEDIGGCRSVVETAEQAYAVYQRLKNSTTKHILFRERDYISNPKESGYRSIHLVYKYNGSKKNHKGLPVELQIRSKIQHSWATAVEVVGTFTKQALKASIGDAKWLDFFRFASAEFSKLEGTNPDMRFDGLNTFSSLKGIADELEVEKRLSAFNVAADKITNETEKNTSYFILRLDLEKRLIRILKFKMVEIEDAMAYYDSEEKKFENDNSIDLVLVSAQSVYDLKRAYPNYFSDTVEFSKNLAKVYAKNNQQWKTN